MDTYCFCQELCYISSFQHVRVWTEAFSEASSQFNRQAPLLPARPNPLTPPRMFRTALLRSARQAVRAAPRCQAPIARPVARYSLFKTQQIAPSVRFQAVRCYASSSGLSRDEVLGRIMDLLKNFDKVMFPYNWTSSMANAVTGYGPQQGTQSELKSVLKIPQLTNTS
jgi:hypothetical protein